MYVHCHNPKCSFSQDDFWSRRYNPATVLWSDIRYYSRPYMTNINERGRYLFSWFHLARCFWWRLSAPFRQKWWTHASWKKAIKNNGGRWPNCPKCGKHELDTD
jgi:hypothetical protein